MRRPAIFRLTSLEDRTTPSASMLDFVGPIQMREDLLAQVMNYKPFTGPVLSPVVRLLTNPVEPPDRLPNLSPLPDFDRLIINPVEPPERLPNLRDTIGDPAILPPIVPLIPPYDVKPIGDPIILPPVVPLTDSIDNTVILDPPYGPYYPFPPTPCADLSSGPNGATIDRPG